MDGDDVIRAIRGFVPHIFINLRAGKHQAAVFHEEFDDFVFHRGQGHLLAVHRHPFGAVVHFQAAVDGDGGSAALLADAEIGIPAQLGFHPGDELHGVEDHIVIGAKFQSQDLIEDFAFGGQHDDGDVPAFPDFHGGVHAVQTGHHDIHEDQLDIRVLLQQFQRLEAVVGLQNLVALGCQVNIHGCRDFAVVVTNQNLLCHDAALLFSLCCYSNAAEGKWAERNLKESLKFARLRQVSDE